MKQHIYIWIDIYIEVERELIIHEEKELMYKYLEKEGNYY